MADFIDSFVTVGELRQMLSKLDDNDFITVTQSHSKPCFKITHVEDSTCCGFWELRIKEV